MAVTKIWPVRGRVDSPLNYAANEEKTSNPKWDKSSLQNLTDVMHYAEDEDKTEKQFFVTGINCNADTARDQFVTVKKQFDKEDGIVAYHGYQSFAEGEVTPELAHKIGIEFAERVWGDDYQVVVATHLNTEHIHNHFIVNSVSFRHGRRCRAKQWYDINKISDEICRSHGLSIVENPKGKGLPYPVYEAEKNGGPTRKNLAKQAVDEAISVSSNMKEFELALKSMGYTCNFDPKRKYWTIKLEGWKKVMRLEGLGSDYSNERIRERIAAAKEDKTFAAFHVAVKVRTLYKLPTRVQKIKKVGGIKGLYLHYCYLLGYLPRYRNNPKKVSPLLRDDLLKMEKIAEECRLLCRENICTDEDLAAFKEKRQFQIDARSELRDDLKNKLRRKVPDEEKEQARIDIASLTEEMKGLRKDLRLIERIEERSVSIKEKIDAYESEVKKDERRR